MQKRCVQAVGVLAMLAVVAIMAPVRAGDADPTVQKTFAKLLVAVKAADRDVFLASAADAVKDSITQAVMDDLKKNLGTRLEKGYKASYLCNLKQAGHQVHLWKLTFKDDGDDVVIRLALKDGKVGGFFLQ